jgi:SAM-dependent methyltransferase
MLRSRTDEEWRSVVLNQGFGDRQRRYWRGVDVSHFDWQTRNPVVSVREAELVSRIALRSGERFLEIGCGEGANLHHLRHDGALRFGIDFSAAKASFAHHATAAHTMTADAARLPFGDAAFEVVLIRDVLHHIDAPAAVLAEAHRVLRPGGRLWLIEPNVRSPLILLQLALISAERGALRSTPAYLGNLVEGAGLRIVRRGHEHPLPLERVLLHPRRGLPSLAASALVNRGLRLVDAAARKLLPKHIWMYLLFEAVRPEEPHA